jgi:hypothetical protein
MSNPSTLIVGKSANGNIPFRADASGNLVVSATASNFSPILISSLDFTRAANTTAYTAGGVIRANAVTSQSFANVIPVAGGSGYIVAARGLTNQASFSATIRLHLYTTDAVSAADQNTSWSSTTPGLWASRASRIGFIDLAGWQTSGSGDSAYTMGSFSGSGSSLPFTLASGSTSLWVIPEVRAAFTPNSGQGFFFSLKTQLA